MPPPAPDLPTPDLPTPAPPPLDRLRERIRAVGVPDMAGAGVLPLGPTIDRHLPGGGLLRGALHEVAGSGAEAEQGAPAASLFVAGALARLEGPVVWAIGAPDAPPFPPALDAVGLHPDRVIYAEAGAPDAVLMVMEEALRLPGLAGVVGEIDGALGLTASRRLHLAAQAGGVIGFALRRPRRVETASLAAPNAAATRWRVIPLPSAPPDPEAPEIGLGPARWRLELWRCRGGVPRVWIAEAWDGGRDSAWDSPGDHRGEGVAADRGGLSAHLADGPDTPADGGRAGAVGAAGRRVA